MAACMIVLVVLSATPAASVLAQQPTGSIATVTGTREGPKVKVYSDRNIIGVYSGPSAYLYPQIGLLLAGEEAPALGYSADRQWIKIIYLGVPEGAGWIYAPFVSVAQGSALVALPNPPTRTPQTTPTIDPTQAALYGVQLTPIQMPTFTQPAPIEIPEYEVSSTERAGLPSGLVIVFLVLVGLLGATISFLRSR